MDEIKQSKAKIEALEAELKLAKAKRDNKAPNPWDDTKGDPQYWHGEVTRISKQLDNAEKLLIQANNNAQRSSQAGTSLLSIFCFVS